jgi:N-acetylmuramoyl-L-alanine amidase
MREINKIIVHCSATREGENFEVAEIRKWHLARGFNDIGYHFYIDLYGEIHKGRDISKIGAHCKGHNRNSIGICYCGGVEADGKTPKDTRLECQKETLFAYANSLYTKVLTKRPVIISTIVQETKYICTVCC